MKSTIDARFIARFRRLPARVQEQTRRAYKLWRNNPSHRSLQFKRVAADEPVYSVRVGIGWRALGLLEDDTIQWFWIGSHAEYDRILKSR